ncbi:MAG: hypothetical protein IJ007_07730 [Oscillospiraceae bacterium]|nr:hypothetical protein [Oscillospiraceae bacterium]
MKNIIKAQFYGLRNERLIAIMFFGLLAALTINGFCGVGNGEALSAGETAAFLLVFEAQLASMFIFMVTGIMCCSDFKDRTANYELMTGHTRKEVYFGRIIPCIVVGAVGWTLLLCIPYTVITVLRGWGTEVSLGSMLLRFFLMYFPVVRIICEFIMISFILRNQYIVMAIGYMMFCIGGLTSMMSGIGSYLLGITNITLLSYIDVWGTFGLSGSMNYVYETAVAPEEIVGTIVFSVIFSVISLYTGYHFFKTDDIN